MIHCRPICESSETCVSDPELAREYPYTLVTGGRIQKCYHFDFRQRQSVCRLHPHPLVQIHPDTARSLGIVEGEWVWIGTRRGSVRQKAVFFADMEPDIIHVEQGWWYPEMPGEEPWFHGVGESGTNVMLDDDPDVCNSLTSAYLLKTALCRVYKVKTH